MTTPPQTPMSTHGGHHSATSSVSGSVLGKRDIGAASESEKEEAKPKKRRVAPTLVGLSSAGPLSTATAVSGSAKEDEKKES